MDGSRSGGSGLCLGPGGNGRMIKKISVEQLEPGMCVHDFNHDWRDPCCQGKDPNRFRGPRMIQNEQAVRLVVDHGIKEVYIDTARGRDVEEALTAAEVEARLAAQLAELGEEEEEGPPKETGFNEEVVKAAVVKAQARKLVGNVLEDARMGKQVVLGEVKGVVREMAESMFRNPDAILSLSLIKQKDEYTFMHSVNVGVFLMSFCRAMEMNEEEIVDVGVGGTLHDIGKMRTPERILNKKGKLTDDEFAIMKQHATFSRRILEKTPGISEISVHIAGQHHERYDGSGYPDRLKGDEINQFGQMAAIVDVYGAITSDRCYHKGNPPPLALKRMLDWSKHHFSLPLYQKFVQCVGIYPMGTLVRLENKLLGVVVRPNRDSLLHPVVKIIIDAKAGKRLQPKEVDLLDFRGNNKAGYRIVGNEPPEKWRVDPKRFMNEPQLYN